MSKLNISIAGLNMPNPIFVGAGPNTKDAVQCIQALKAGAGAVEFRGPGNGGATGYVTTDQLRILPEPKDAYYNRYFGYASTSFKRKSEVPELSVEWKQEQIRTIKEETKGLGALVVNIGHVGYDGYPEKGEEYTWGELGVLSEQAGADAIMLHLQTGQSMGGKRLAEEPERLRKIISEVKKNVTVPVIAKLPIEGCNPLWVAKEAVEAGIDGIAPTARFVGLDIDIDIETVPEWGGFHGYGGSWALPFTAAWTAHIRSENASIPMIPGGGVMGWEDMIRLILLGADMVQVCTWSILKGYDAIPGALRKLNAWMEQKGYRCIEDFRGNALKNIVDSKKVWGRTVYNNPYRELFVDHTKCNGCKACKNPCFYNAISFNSEGKCNIDLAKCAECGCCFNVCPQSAIIAPHKGV